MEKEKSTKHKAQKWASDTHGNKSFRSVLIGAVDEIKNGNKRRKGVSVITNKTFVWYLYTFSNTHYFFTLVVRV